MSDATVQWNSPHQRQRQRQRQRRKRCRLVPHCHNPASLSSLQNRIYICIWACVVVIFQQGKPADASEHVLMIGNSYTFSNNMDVMLKNLLEEGMTLTLQVPGPDDVFVRRMTRPGATLSLHANDVSVLNTITGSIPWTAVVLQEQSQTPGMWSSWFLEELFTASLDAVITLDEYIRGDQNNKNIDTVLMMTWGRRIRDNRNPNLYPDFITMQSKIAEGYYRYRDTLKTINTNAERPDNIKIAPVGLAFQAIYDAIIEQGLDPTLDGTDFSKLYSDGSHPSVHGTYLAACVLYMTLTDVGSDVRLLEWAPVDLSNLERDRLQAVAYQTVLDFNEQQQQQSPSLQPSSQSSFLSMYPSWSPSPSPTTSAFMSSSNPPSESSFDWNLPWIIPWLNTETESSAQPQQTAIPSAGPFTTKYSSSMISLQPSSSEILTVLPSSSSSSTTEPSSDHLTGVPTEFPSSTTSKVPSRPSPLVDTSSDGPTRTTSMTPSDMPSLTPSTMPSSSSSSLDSFIPFVDSIAPSNFRGTVVSPDTISLSPVVPDINLDSSVVIDQEDLSSDQSEPSFVPTVVVVTSSPGDAPSPSTTPSTNTGKNPPSETPTTANLVLQSSDTSSRAFVAQGTNTDDNSSEKDNLILQSSETSSRAFVEGTTDDSKKDNISNETNVEASLSSITTTTTTIISPPPSSSQGILLGDNYQQSTTADEDEKSAKSSSNQLQKDDEDDEGSNTSTATTSTAYSKNHHAIGYYYFISSMIITTLLSIHNIL